MNFLAHLLLSGEEEEVMLGNFMADSVKSKVFSTYTKGVQHGILLHRSIDNYTDNHPIVMQTKLRLRPQFAKYSPVVADIFYDHFLALHWSKYSTTAFDDYIIKVYQMCSKHYNILPERTRRFTNYMIKENILKQYTVIEGMQRVFEGMARRSNFDSGMQHAVDALKEHYSLYEKEFLQFFPQLSSFVDSFMVGE